MLVTTYLGTSSQIQYWSLHVLIPGGGPSDFGIYMCIGLYIYIYRSANALVFPYMFISVDCFNWGLIDHIEQQRDHSVHWQFWMGGPSDFGISMFSICTGISLYFLISWPFWMGSHWWHWKAKSSLCGLAVSNGGSIWLWYLYVFYMHWYFLIFSYKLTISNGLSLMTLNSEEFTLCSGSFKLGVCQIYPPGVNLKIWAHLLFYTLLHRGSFHITYEKPNK